jgi:hypothetical protein
VEKDGDRDYWMVAEEAKAYGMIDELLVRIPNSVGTSPLPAPASTRRGRVDPRAFKRILRALRPLTTRPTGNSTMDKKEIKCSFCGRDKQDTNVLIAGITGHICDSCITQAQNIIQEN